MMALSDEPRSEGEATGALGPLARMVLIGTLMVLCVFALGALTGMAVRIFEEGDISTRQLLAGGLAVATIAASLWIIARLRRATRDEPMPASVRKSNRLLWISLFLGGALGMFMALGSEMGGSEFDLTSNQPISPAIAGIVIAVWLVTLPVLTVRFYRTIDEHARGLQFRRADRPSPVLHRRACLVVRMAWRLSSGARHDACVRRADGRVVRGLGLAPLSLKDIRTTSINPPRSKGMN